MTNIRWALWTFVRGLLPSARSLVVLPLFFLLLFVGIFGLQSACYPWAHSITFGRTLVGMWVGELTPARRGTHILFLDLRDDISEDAGPDLRGTARLCDTRGELHEFGITGRTQNWRGTRFHLRTFITERRDGEGVELGGVDGEWDRGDTLRLDVKPELWRIRGGGTISSTDRPPEQIALEDTIVPSTLTRAGEREFRDACDRLRRAGDRRNR
jgi:hypothetical protein